LKIQSERKNGVIFSYLGMGVEVLVSLIYTPIMLRLLGQSGYGVYQAAASVISYLSILSLGFNSSYMRFYARYKTNNDCDGIKRLNYLFLLVFGIAALLSVGAGAILSSSPATVFGNKFTADEINTSGVLLLIMAVNMAISFLSSVFSMYVNALEKFTFQQVLNIVSTILKPTVTLPLLLMGYGSIGLTSASTVVTLAVAVANFACAKKNGWMCSFGKLDTALLKEISVFSFFVFLSSVAGTINGTIDKLLLSNYEGSGAVAIYEIGERFNGYLMMFSVNVSAIFIPKVNLLVADNCNKQNMTDLMIRIGRIQFMLISFILCGFILVGKPFIIFYAGVEYGESFKIALVLMVASFVPYIQNIGIEIQKAMNKHWFRSTAYLLISFANILISIPLIRTLGIGGAALGTALSLLLGNTIAMNVYYRFGIGLNMKSFWKKILRPFLAVCVAFGPFYGYTLFRPVSSMLEFAVIVIAFSAVFWIVMWIYGMNSEEQEMVKGILHLKHE